MPKIIEWLFMLQRHQLIRWGRTCAAVTIGMGLAAIVAALWGVWFVEARLEPLLASNRALDRKNIASIAKIEDLREYSLRSQERYASAEGEFIRLVGCSFVVLASLGVFSLSYGLLYLRARQLALEVDKAEQSGGSNESTLSGLD
jgi:hypothetical protein